ncbi:MAG: encapsulin [Pseudonocardiaceae bacterium]
MTDHLLRKYAPIPATGWQQIDAEAKERVTGRLAARRPVDWSGPHGWAHSATNLGRTTSLAGRTTWKKAPASASPNLTPPSTSPRDSPRCLMSLVRNSVG